MEEQLRKAVEQQRLLVKEASHRVKNSLAILSSLMLMQARSVKTDEAATALGDASGRIMAVAATHDHLWRQNMTETVELSELLPKLCEQLGGQAPAHQIHCKIDRFSVETSAATSIALVVSEAVTNAVKYAYPSGGGPIEILLQRKNDTATLTVSDQGVGLPDGFDIGMVQLDSLGIQLIMTLSATVGREARFETNGGTRVIIHEIRGSSVNQ